MLATALGAVPVVTIGGVGTGGTAWAAPASGGTAVSGLSVERRDEPLGIDVRRPRFGWRMESAQRGRGQSAYRILVASTATRLRQGVGDLWDSGRVRSSDSVAVSYGGKALRASTRYFWTVTVWDDKGRVVNGTPTGTFETALMSTDGVTGWDGARWIGMKGKALNSAGAPMLRREVPLRSTGAGKGRAKVREARLYISALGVYDAYINGRRVSVPQDRGTTVELLTPGWTNYDTCVNYMTYDVTDLVARKPVVTLAAVLGNGWYNSRVSDPSAYYSRTGNALALKAKLLVRYEDDTSQVIVTRPGDGWKATDAGPFRADDIYDGQTYDARQEMEGWASSGFDDTAWSDVEAVAFEGKFPDSKLIAYPGETARLMPRWDRQPQSITVYSQIAGQATSANGKGHIVPDPARSVSERAKAAHAAVTLRTGDTAVYDLGQNIVGVPRYTLRGPAGAQVFFKFAEMLNDTSAGADGPAGSVYRANLRTAKATSTYILKGAEAGESHQDSLSFYGFRYVSVEITTPDTEVTITGLTGRVATSAIRDTGSIATNDDRINQLVSNVRWGQRGNYLWIPTDCPQRDERLGWTGDTQLFAATALYNADVVNFLSHFQNTLIESQKTYGRDGAQFTAVAPGNKYRISDPMSGWSDVGVIVPWTVWQMSGDRTIIDDSWSAMTRYMDWIYRQTGDTYAGQGAIFGDWLAPQKTSAQLTSDVYYGYSALLMAHMARATGRKADEDKYDKVFTGVKRAFIAKYLDTEDGKLALRSSLGDASPIEPGADPNQRTEDNSQTALLWALKLGLFETEAQRRELLGLLVENIGNDAAYKAAHPDSSRVRYEENTLSVGFLGVNVLAPVLTAQGRTDVAYELLHQNAMPSWLYSVDNGATTVWERWNSYSEEDGFGPVSMNSFNHYAYGAIVEWMYESMAGIARDPEKPGFQHFFLQPHIDPTGRLRQVSGSHQAPYGEIRSEWTLTKGDRLDYHAVVPANSEATLRIPAASASSVREGRTSLQHVDGVRFLGFQDGTASYRLPSGTYRLTSTLR